MADARDLFHAAAGPPSPAGPNVEAITRRGRALRRRRQLLLGASGAVAIVVLASVVALVGTSRDAVVEQPATATVTPRVDPSRPSTPVPNAGTTTLTVYLLAAATDGCSRLQPVQRTVPALSINNDVRAPAALRQLFAGPTAQERARGLHSVIGETQLQSVRLLDGFVFIDVSSGLPTDLSRAGSCGAASFQAQVESTLQPYAEPSELRFALNGGPAAFYALIGKTCAQHPQQLLDVCDPDPFLTPGPGSGLEPADGYLPAAGVCGEAPGPIVTIGISEVPEPRCIVVRPRQRLRVVNATAIHGRPGRPVTLSFASFHDRTLQPGGSTLYDRPFGDLLAPGHHNVRVSIFPGSGGAELILRSR